MPNLFQTIKSHLSKSIPPTEKAMIAKAYKIAHNTLRGRYSDKGIRAGKTHFSDIWARDSFFASFGCLSIGDKRIVKANLQTMLKFMRHNGQIPLRIGQKNMMMKLMGLRWGWQPVYREDKKNCLPVDSNSLFIIVIAKYLEVSNDIDFVRANFLKARKIIEWNFTMDKDNDLLLEEEEYASWTDSLRKRGKVLYSNVLHYKAVKSFALISKILNETAAKDHYSELALKIKAKINEQFWNGQYYIDWIHKHRHKYFSTDGNMLAIVFDLADKNKAMKIQECIREFDMDHGFTTQTNYPKYHYRHIFPLFYPIRLPDYHNGLQWLWIGCVDAVAKHKIGMETEARKLLLKLARKIDEYNGVYEVYFNGKPVKRFFYKSEKSFAWSAGLFIWAGMELGIIDK
ncbi:amylo-alpha-1,6-glucosidase [Candidatus Margulisiibacteriota bacterium]